LAIALDGRALPRGFCSSPLGLSTNEPIFERAKAPHQQFMAATKRRPQSRLLEYGYILLFESTDIPRTP
jgi:hypothetical protein